MTDQAPERPPRIDCVLIAGGKFHDIDFARLELLKLLAEDPAIRVRVFEDFEHVEAIARADMLVTYTCDVAPSLVAQEALKAWLEGGGRWYALHGTNSILRLLDDGVWATPAWAPLFMELLGSQFTGHPPIAPYRVTVAAPEHALVAGVEPFETTDELYHLESFGPLEVLLHTQSVEPATGFQQTLPTTADHPVFYIKSHGRGAVLYLTLGHCRGHYDLQPLADWWPTVDRGAWALPTFYTLLRRGLIWATARPVHLADRRPPGR